MLFHHAHVLAQVRHSVVRPVRDEPPAGEFAPAYAWLEGRLGFRPLFLAVGEDDEDRRMTGYQDHWRRRPRGAAPEPSRALFSWPQAPPGAVLMDFAAWHVVLNTPGDVQPSDERSLWKRSWTTGDWVRAARRGTTSVQAVVPALDLRTAEEVLCRNRAERGALVRLGFDPARVRVRRLTVG